MLIYNHSKLNWWCKIGVFVVNIWCVYAKKKVQYIAP
jgi:hypothetical protein